jgi:hypothetical protein
VEALPYADLVLGAGIVALFLVGVFCTLDLIGAVVELLFLRAILLAVGWTGAAIGLEIVLPGEGVKVAGGIGMLLLAALTIRYRRAEAANDARAAEEQRLKAEARRIRGVRTTGRITKLERTGWTINDSPQVTFTLDVPLHDGREAEITVTRLVDPLEAPRFQPGCSVTVVYDRDDPQNFDVSWDPTPGQPAPPTATTAVPLSGTGAPFERPLWLFGTEGAEKWLLRPRRATSPPLVIVDFTDPHDATAGEDRELTVDLAAFLLAEELWLTTDASVAAAALVEVEKRKVLQLVGPHRTWAELEPFVNSLDPRPIVAWGSALPDLAREGIRLSIRHPADEVERTMSGPLAELPDMLIDWLERRQAAARTPPPAWWRSPPPGLVAAYCRGLHDLELQILADASNAALDPLDADVHATCLTRALDVADAHGDECPMLRVVAVTIAHYAARANRLPPPARHRAVGFVRAAAPGSPLFALAPLLLRRLGEPLEATARAQAAERDASPAHREWLERIASVATAMPSVRRAPARPP